MIRRAVTALGAFAILAAADPASAGEPPGMFATFQSICMAPRLDYDLVATKARQVGLVEPKDVSVTGAGLPESRVFMMGPPSDPTRMLILGKPDSQFGSSSIVGMVCIVTGKRDDVAVAAARAWVRDIPPTVVPGGTTYTFRNTDSGRIPLPAGDDDAVRAAAAAGELVAFVIQDTPDQTSLVVLRSQLAKVDP